MKLSADPSTASSTMARRLLLLFAYHFPPDNEIGSARPFRFFKYLPDYGYECHVFTAAPPEDQERPGVSYVPDPLLAPSDRGLGRTIELAVRKFLVPGQLGCRWALAAARESSQFISHNAGARVTIFSTFPPIGALLAALHLHRQSSLKWVSDFRDPLVVGGPTSFLQDRFTRWLESESMRMSDLVIANTDAARQMFASRYAKHERKLKVIWNGFDPDDTFPPPPADGPVRILSHVGDLYAGRDPRPIIQSAKRLIAGGLLRPEQFRLQFVGFADPKLFADAFDARQSGWLHYTLERQPGQYARRISQESHALLLMQPGTAVQVPAKLFEFIRSQRPILAYIVKDSPVEQLLLRSGVSYRAFYPDSPPDFIDQMLLEFLTTPPQVSKPNRWFEDQFNAKYQARQLAMMLDELYESSGRTL
jgi:hypothetical protein